MLGIRKSLKKEYKKQLKHILNLVPYADAPYAKKTITEQGGQLISNLLKHLERKKTTKDLVLDVLLNRYKDRDPKMKELNSPIDFFEHYKGYKKFEKKLKKHRGELFCIIGSAINPDLQRVFGKVVKNRKVISSDGYNLCIEAEKIGCKPTVGNIIYNFKEGKYDPRKLYSFPQKYLFYSEIQDKEKFEIVRGMVLYHMKDLFPRIEEEYKERANLTT